MQVWIWVLIWQCTHAACCDGFRETQPPAIVLLARKIYPQEQQPQGGYSNDIIDRPRHQPPQFFAISGGKSAVCLRGAVGLWRGNPVEAARSNDLGAGRRR